MDHRRRVTCCWAWALCILWTAAAADQPLSIPIPKIFTGMAASPTSTMVPHSTGNTITGSRAFNNASGAPSYTTTEAASLPASMSIASTISPRVPTLPPEQVMPSEAPPAPSASSRTPSSPVATTMSQRPASPGPTLGTARGEITRPPYVPPATPSRRSTLLTPSGGGTPPPPVQVVLAEEKNRGENEAAPPNTEPETAPAPLCDYNTCVHLQRPCLELKHLKGWTCRCPTQSAADPSATPGPVVALEVTGVWPTAASVRWCAPDSAPSAFLVWVLRGDDGSVVSNGSVSSRTRQTDVFGLAAGGHRYSVCVSAQSATGALSHKRCVPVATANDAEAIAVYVLSGVCGVLLLAAVVLSLCLCRQCERRGRASCREPAHLNPAAHAFHDPRLTCSMVSIANPAYAPADELAAARSANAHRASAKKSTDVR